MPAGSEEYSRVVAEAVIFVARYTYRQHSGYEQNYYQRVFELLKETREQRLLPGGCQYIGAVRLRLSSTCASVRPV